MKDQEEQDNYHNNNMTIEGYRPDKVGLLIGYCGFSFRTMGLFIVLNECFKYVIHSSG